MVLAIIISIKKLIIIQAQSGVIYFFRNTKN